MDIGRDLIDHRIVDLDGHDVGRVDDLWVYVSGGRATVGPIVSGAAALFQQFGALGRRLQRIAPRVGYRHATRWRELAGTTSTPCSDPKSCSPRGSPTSPPAPRATSRDPARRCSTPD